MSELPDFDWGPGESRDDIVKRMKAMGAVDVTDSIRRRIIWDSMPCEMAPEIIKLMGLMPGTSEGDEFEHKDSHRRAERLMPIENYVLLVTSLTGEVIAKTMLHYQFGEDDPDTSDLTYQSYLRVVYAGTLAVLGNLLDMGAINVCESEEEVTLL